MREKLRRQLRRQFVLECRINRKGRPLMDNSSTNRRLINETAGVQNRRSRFLEYLTPGADQAGSAYDDIDPIVNPGRKVRDQS